MQIGVLARLTILISLRHPGMAKNEKSFYSMPHAEHRVLDFLFIFQAF
jgi:hypothetical protein